MAHVSPPVVTTRPRTPKDVVVGPELLDLLSAGAPLTVLRGPRGYGKTTLIGAWLDARPPERFAYLRLTHACNDRLVFWEGLESALAEHGVLAARTAEDQDDDARARVLGELAVLTGPVTIVLDDFHHAGRDEAAAEIDEELVELVRQNDRLDLVVATRATRVIETTGSLSIDVTVVSPEELRLSATQVVALAERLGHSLSRGQAVLLAAGFGGWPAAIRDLLVRSHGEGGHINLALADQYIAAMVRDLRHEAVRSFMLRTAVPEEFDADLAQLLAPGEKVLTILGNVRAAGLLREEIQDEGRVYSYAPLVRQALVRVLSESRPEDLREVHATLMEWHIHQGDHVRAIMHAIHAQEWARVEQLMEDHWPHLITQEPWELVAAAQQIPAEVAAQRPRLQVAREEVGPALQPLEADLALPLWPTGDLLGLTTEISSVGARGATDGTAPALLQWGVAAILAGDLTTALYAFGRARARGQRTGDVIGALRPATVGLAVTHALLGEVDIALSWLGDEALRGTEAEPPGRDGPDLMVAGVRVTRAIVALETLADDLAEVVADLGERSRRDEVWSLMVLLKASCATMTEDAAGITRWAANLRSARHYLPHGGLTELLLRVGLVETLLVGGMMPAARQAAADLPALAVSTPVLARLALAEGDPARAVALARSVLPHPRLTQRAAMYCQVVLAAAHHVLGERLAARRAFDEAVEIANGSGLRRPLTSMPLPTFLALADGNPGVLALWPGRG
ncbi:MalT transcriptional regulator family protein, partial [Georgenia sp.]